MFQEHETQTSSRLQSGPSPSYCKAPWNTKVVAGIFKWAGSVEDQFGIKNEASLKVTIRNLWNLYLPPPKDSSATCTHEDTEQLRVDHPAVLKFVTFRTSRSQTGQRALAVVKADVLKSEAVGE
ncbi:hypothetical protein K435DRAFT_799240 [Dendrothele bispora CBS 962.96]|uniref:Uncharacterized protein n=1 Tax=Dendrothele bispora (strain CBS 962.96) TaxID=1314807 RepID=A0A4S8LWE8_DENBC|nr:hypothetical protein K435DRAFT_860927 [Dendrothele bispora CBS 962.96]THU94019.1 hypothetical protein K435DRAFT_799205 [Dendrothele bispora CBS 962.96]THU94062.1 hypothetical protein K435DRAFT_799240 [Dendrothele bispora CBS 962.96]